MLGKVEGGRRRGQQRMRLLDGITDEIAQLCPILCDPMDCSLPGSSVHGISQARILEWVAISFSRGSFPNPEIELASPELEGFFTTELLSGSPS